MNPRPGTPGVLRELNDRAALELLSTSGPLTRGQISGMTGLSKVTASQVLSRLEERGLVVQAGTQEGGRGRSATLFGLNPSSGYVIGFEADMQTTTAALADVTGKVLAEATTPTDHAQEPVEAVNTLAERIAEGAGIGMAQVRECVIGVSAVIDPETDDVSYCYDMPAWRTGVLGALRERLELPVVIDNDVNLAAVAERVHGAATAARTFVLVWIGRGPGSAVMVGDQLLRGTSGAAGEIGWMPVSGAPVGDGILDRGRGGVGAAFQTLVGWRAIQELAETHEIAAGTLEETVVAATESAAGGPFLDELARRIALGVASICTVLDPELIVLGSDVGAAGGAELAGRVQRAIPGMCLARPRVEPSMIMDRPVMRGALHTAIGRARERLFADVGE